MCEKINNVMSREAISVKRFVGLLVGIFILSLLAVACSGTETQTNQNQEVESQNDTTSLDGQMVFASWGGAFQEAQEEALLTPFSEMFDVEVTSDSTADYGKFTSMVETGNVSWDVMHSGGEFIYRATEQDLLEPIDYDIVDVTDMPEELVHPYGVFNVSTSNLLAWNTDLVGDNPPKNWEALWDMETYPGKRALWDSAKTSIEIALLADGVSPNELYPLNEDKIERAFNKLDQIKNDVVWWTSGAEPAQLLSSGEVVMAMAWNGRVQPVKAEGGPVDFTFEQALLSIDGMVIPKGAPNKTAAMHFLNFVMQAESQAELGKLLPYGPTNPNAYDFLSDEEAAELNSSPENIQKQVYIAEEWWGGPEGTELAERWKAWLIE